MSPEPVSPWPHADNCVPQMCAEWTPPPCSIDNHASCTEMPASHGTIGNPPSGGALTAEPGSDVATALTKHEMTFGQMAEHPAGTLGDLAPHQPAWAIDTPFMGIGLALALLIGLAVVTTRRLRKRHVTSPDVTEETHA